MNENPDLQKFYRNEAELERKAAIRQRMFLILVIVILALLIYLFDR
jgi:hypothetical protein